MSLQGPADEIVVTGMASVAGPDLEGALERLPGAIRARAVRAERVTQLALTAADAALRGAGITGRDGGPDPRFGIVLGTAFGCLLTNALHQRRLAETGPGGVSPRTFAATVSNAATGEITIAYGLGGPALTVTAGLVSGLAAVAEGRALMASGGLAALLAGGADAWGAPLARWLGDAGLAEAIVPGEGAAFVVLERRWDAVARGARPLACLEVAATGFEAESRETPRLLPDWGGQAIEGAPVFPGLGERALVAALQWLASAAGGTRCIVRDRCPTGQVAAVAWRREEAG